MSAVYIVSALSMIYGLGWLIFTFVEPPSSLSYVFRAPGAFYFLPERAGRFVMALIFMGVIPAVSTTIVSMAMG